MNKFEDDIWKNFQFGRVFDINVNSCSFFTSLERNLTCDNALSSFSANEVQKQLHVVVLFPDFFVFLFLCELRLFIWGLYTF